MTTSTQKVWGRVAFINLHTGIQKDAFTQDLEIWKYKHEAKHWTDFMSKVISAIRNHPGFQHLSEDKQESMTAVEFRNDVEADEYHIWMKRILDGEVAAVNRKQKSSEVNYHNEAYENDSSGEEWTPENKPEKKKKPSKEEQTEVENLAKRLKALKVIVIPPVPEGL